jgi:hypothetical protein
VNNTGNKQGSIMKKTEFQERKTEIMQHGSMAAWQQSGHSDSKG